jgi:hypothetical protein
VHLFPGNIVGVKSDFVKEELSDGFSVGQILLGRHQAGDILTVVATLDGHA